MCELYEIYFVFESIYFVSNSHKRGALVIVSASCSIKRIDSYCYACFVEYRRSHRSNPKEVLSTTPRHYTRRKQQVVVEKGIREWRVEE